MELLEIAKKIEEKIQLLERGRGGLLPLAIERATKLAKYDKQLAIVLIGLKNGVAMSCQEAIIQNPPATIAEKIAKGICWQGKLEMEKADTEYKLAVQKLSCVEAELNGYQSIFRYLSEI